MEGDSPLTRIYPSTGSRMQLLHLRLVFFSLIGQSFGPGPVSSRVRALAFLKAIRHLVTFVVGTRT